MIRKAKVVFAIWLCIIAVLIPVNAFGKSSVKRKSSKNKTTKSKETRGKLKIHFIDIGEGDSILLENEGHYMMVDYGEAYSYKKLKKYLKDKKIKKLDFAVLTHEHKDHIGGMANFLKDFKPKKVLMSSPDVSKKESRYRKCLKICKKKKYPVVRPKKGDKFTLGNATIRVISVGTKEKKPADKNNHCMVLRVGFGKKRILLMADATKVIENEIMNGKYKYHADVIKISHHGAKENTSKEFLEKVNAQHAVVSVGVENTLHHPSPLTLNMIKNCGMSLRRTDRQGTIIMTTDGETITWNVNPTTDLSGND